MNAISLNPQEVIFSHNNELRTNSLNVAKVFGKLHKDVIRKIESLDCSDDFTLAHFCAHVQKVGIGQGATRESKYYEMTKDGFMFLVMGFTGKKAAQLKESYINAFNWMARQILNHKTTTDQRTPLRDAVNLLVGKKGLMYPEAYSVIHQRFNVKHIDELSSDQVPMAIEYVHKLTLEAEWLPEGKRSLIESKPTYHLEPIPFPSLKSGLHPQSSQVFFDFSSMFWMREMRNAPIATIIRVLTKQGYDTAGVATEYKGLMHLLEIYHDRLERIEKICSRREAMAINLSSKLNRL